MVKVKKFLSLLLVVILTGCANSSSSELAQEEVLQKVNNYKELITIYRSKLSQKESQSTRYKLAEYYYLAGDYGSSSYYLSPLLSSNPDEKVYLLEGKNQLELGKLELALNMTNKALKINKKTPEPYNLAGIILASKGELDQAEKHFNEARKRNAKEEDVINNLAMVHILREDYSSAVELLMPLFSRGIENPKINRNLVYSLVKSDQLVLADEVLKRSGVQTGRESLLVELAMIKPRMPKLKM